jgi:outer membrane protein assembly factor BamB
MKKLFSLRLTLLCIFLLTSLASSNEAIWERNFDKEVLWQNLSDSGFLIVSTKEALFGLDPSSGETAWELPQFKKLPEDMISMLPMTQFGMITYKGGPMGFGTTTYLVNMIDGNILWDSSKLGILQSFGQFYMPEIGGVLLFGSTKDDGANVMMLAELATGDLIWKKAGQFKKGIQMFSISQKKKMRVAVMGNQRPIQAGDGFIEYLSAGGLRKFNSQTGELIWKSDLKLKGVPALRYGYPQMQLSQDGKTIYIPHLRNLYAVDTETGALLWDKQKKLKGFPFQMSVTNQGIVVKGGPAGPKGKGKPFIMVIDPKTGNLAWKKPFKDLKNASSFSIDDDNIVLYADKSIFKISIADGSSDEISKKIKFKDGEIPGILAIRENGYLLQGTQNIALYDFNGKQIYHSYVKAPQSSLLAKVASTAILAAVNAGSAAGAYSRAMSTGSSQSYSLITSNPVMSERFSQTASSENYVYMIGVPGKGSNKKGAGVVQLNKITGEEEKSVVLSVKKPSYELDEIGQRLFFKPDKKTIKCYDF